MPVPMSRVSIHADGGPVDGRGFSILEPVASGVNDGVIGASQILGEQVRRAFLAETPMPVSDYYGVNGIVPRDDLGGLNLTTVPKVMVECGEHAESDRRGTARRPCLPATGRRRHWPTAITTFLTDAASGSGSVSTTVARR